MLQQLQRSSSNVLRICKLVYKNNNTLYLKRVARNSYKTSKLVALYLKLQQK